LLWQSLLRLLYCGPIENLICLHIVREHLLELEIDLLVQVQQLGVGDLENALSVLLAKHFLNFLVEIADAHQVAIFKVLIQLR